MRIGIFGGTFDPPHFGHMVLAMEAQYQLKLDRLVWVLTGSPPHKQNQPITPIEQRLAMLLAAVEHNPQFEISHIEIDRPGPHYAADTLSALTCEYPQVEWCYLIGGDSLRDLSHWYQPEKLLSACAILGVMRRPGDEVDLDKLEHNLPGIRSKVQYIHTPMLEISSSEIRSRIAEAKPFRYFLLPAVYNLIVKQGYYQIT